VRHGWQISGCSERRPARRAVADRPNWTIARLRAEIEAREGVRINRSQLSKALRKKFRWRRPRHTLKGRQTASEVDRIGLRLQLRKCQAEAGDIVLLYGDESEALTHPYLARAWAKSGADLRVPAPGQDLMSVSGLGEPGKEARPGLCPGPAKGKALGTNQAVIALGLISLPPDDS